jgi:predicted transcriptional regulator
MPDETQKGLERDTAEIVSAYVRHHQLPADEIAALIRSVHTTLSNLGKPTEEEVERVPAVPVRRSVHRDYVVCLECGWRGKMLRRHISSGHGLNPTEYRHRWSLSNDHPLTAPAYTEQRSDLAKKLGLGRRGGDPAEDAMSEPELRPEPRKPSTRRKQRGKAAATE